MATWQTDTDFEELTLAEVSREGDGYALKRSDGWSMWIEDPGFVPVVGQTAKFFGKGIGYSVRGVVIGDRECFYHTPAEHDQHEKDSLYPRTAANALAKWDSGHSVFTIEMGGLGPGYEQCIHVLAFEIIRAALMDGAATELATFELIADATVTRVDKHLGLSGAQVGAAKWLAFWTLREGWQKTVLNHGARRRIQVSKAWPHIPDEA